jgi:hypothetical protein
MLQLKKKNVICQTCMVAATHAVPLGSVHHCHASPEDNCWLEAHGHLLTRDGKQHASGPLPLREHDAYAITPVVQRITLPAKLGVRSDNGSEHCGDQTLACMSVFYDGCGMLAIWRVLESGTLQRSWLVVARAHQSQAH